MAVLLLALAGTLLFLWIARTQARAMFRFVDSEDAVRTSPPEHLSVVQKAKVILGGVTVPRPRNSADPKGSLGLDFSSVEIDNGQGDMLSVWKIPASVTDADAPAPAPLVLLFHGYAASKESLLAAARELHALGCECWLVDFFGSGESSGNHTTFGWREAQDVDAVARLAREAVADSVVPRSLVLYGVSMGGSAVMRALAELGTPTDGAIVESVFHNLRGTVARRFHLMQLPAFPSADALLWFGGRDLGFDARRHNPLDYARQIRCPVLLLHGSRDTRAPVEKARDIRDACAGPVRLVEFDAGHQVLCDKAPESWRQAVTEFFAALPAPQHAPEADRRQR